MDYRLCQGEIVSLGDNGVRVAEGTGKIVINKLVNGVWKLGSIENVLYVPSLRKNLFSVGVCTTKDFEVRFKGKHVIVLMNGKIVAQGTKQDNDIFRMFFRVVKPDEANVSSVVNLNVWHERMGHGIVVLSVTWQIKVMFVD